MKNGKYKYKDGSIAWYKDDKLHREDGPSNEDIDGSKFWHKDDKLHRLDGPAIERIDGTKEWWKEGMLHREDGPALIDDRFGIKEWYLNGSLVYSDDEDYTSKFELSDTMKKSIIKYKLERL